MKSKLLLRSNEKASVKGKVVLLLENSLSTFRQRGWRRKWQPTPVFLPGESQGRRSLVGCHLWGRTELGTTEMNYQQQQQAERLRGTKVKAKFK